MDQKQKLLAYEAHKDSIFLWLGFLSFVLFDRHQLSSDRTRRCWPLFSFLTFREVVTIAVMPVRTEQKMIIVKAEISFIGPEENALSTSKTPCLAIDEREKHLSISSLVQKI